MATVHGNFLKGVLGNLSFKVVNGKQLVSQRRAPGTTKQTEAVKNAQLTFGKSARLALRIRMFYKSLIDHSTDSGMVNRLNSRIIEILNDCCAPDTRRYTFGRDSFNKLSGFEFNIKSPLSGSLHVTPVVEVNNGKLELSLPKAGAASILKFPTGATACRMIASLALIRLGPGLCAYSVTNQEVLFWPAAPETGNTAFHFQVPNDCLCLVTLSLKYTEVKNNEPVLVNDQSFNPVTICGAVVTPGVYLNLDNRAWMKMHNLDFGDGE